MKPKKGRGRPRKYPKDDPQAIIKISLAQSLKKEVESRAEEECSGNVSEYAVRALVHYMTCEKVAIAKLHGTEVLLSNDAKIVVVEPPADFNPLSLFESARRIVESAISCRLIKHHRFAIDINENYRLNPENIIQLESEYKSFEKLVDTLREEKRRKALSFLFDIMLSEYDRLKILPEYIEWLGLSYGYAGPSIDEQ